MNRAAVLAVSRKDRFCIVASHGNGEHRHRIMIASDSPMQSEGVIENIHDWDLTISDCFSVSIRNPHFAIRNQQGGTV